ncbi:MAG: urate hydroxylase PuuD [Alphaproteobacteria bacterium]
MDLVVTEWLTAGVRWLHVIAGIAWIGTSFYFIHLDLSLRRRDGLPDGVQGEAYQVHGGGFYHMVKYMVAPSHLPADLAWFKWEAYMTWLSGTALLVLVYYVGAELYLIDRTVLDIEAWQAIALSAGTLLVAWLVYEALCRSPLGSHEGALAAVGYVFLVALTWAFTQMFSGRGAFIQIGALIGTIMVANVWAVIMPNQRRIVAALLAGEKPDPRLGAQGKQRSVHNNYLTLPVVFLMLANHYPLFYATRYNWLIVAVVLALGPLIRHFFNERHAGRPSPWWVWGATAVGLLAVAWLSAAGPRERQAMIPVFPPAFAEVETVIASRCAMCHAAQPTWDIVASAPRGVRLDTPDDIRRHARQIAIAAARSDAMPPGNVSAMTREERAMLVAWFAAGAPLAGETTHAR